MKVYVSRLEIFSLRNELLLVPSSGPRAGGMLRALRLVSEALGSSCGWRPTQGTARKQLTTDLSTARDLEAQQPFPRDAVCWRPRDSQAHVLLLRRPQLVGDRQLITRVPATKTRWTKVRSRALKPVGGGGCP